MNVLAGIESVLGAHEMSLLLRMVAPEPGAGGGTGLAVYKRWAGEKRVDGVILFDHFHQDPRPPLLDALGLPYVRLGAPEGAGTTAKSASTTVAQNVDAATLVEALHERGHRHIAYVSGPLALMHEVARSASIRSHAQRLGMTAVFTPSDYTADDGGTATIAVVAGLVPGSAEFPTGIIYGNDLMAVGGLRALKRLGLAVPGQVSILSWDDSMLCQFSSPAVAALGHDIMDLGKRSAALLLEIIGGHETRNVPSPPGRLLPRESLSQATHVLDS